MAMPEAVYAVIKEACADKKVTISGDEVTLLDYITGKEGLYDKAEGAVKIQDANKDLTEQRKKWEDKEKAYKTDLDKAKEDLKVAKQNQPSPEDIKKLEELQKKGMTPEIEARINAIEKERDDANIALATAQKSVEDATILATNATRASVEKDLDNRLLTAFNKHNINGAQADVGVLLIKQKGNVKISPKDEGGFSEQYYTYSDGKVLESTFDKVVESFATENEFLKDGTSAGGSGDNHRGTPNTNSTKTFADMLR